MQMSEEMTAVRRLGGIVLFVMRRALQNEITTRQAEGGFIKPLAKFNLKYVSQDLGQNLKFMGPSHYL